MVTPVVLVSTEDGRARFLQVTNLAMSANCVLFIDRRLLFAEYGKCNPTLVNATRLLWGSGWRTLRHHYRKPWVNDARPKQLGGKRHICSF